jgi:hypothetical protein
MKKMHGVYPLVLGFAVFLISACSLAFEMPQKIRVVANPGIAVSLPETEETVSQLFDDAIRDAFAEQGDMAIYNWQNKDWEGIQAYLIHYGMDPITVDLPALQEVEGYSIGQDVQDLDPIHIPEMTIELDGESLSLPGDMEIVLPSPGPYYFAINLGDKVQNVKIGSGPSGEKSFLELGNEGDDYSDVTLTLCQGDYSPVSDQIPLINDGAKRKFDLTGMEISASPPPRLYISGTIRTGLNGIVAIRSEFNIKNFAEITILDDTAEPVNNSISLDSLPDSMNYITFAEVGVDFTAGFTRELSGGGSAPIPGVKIKGLTIDINVPALGINSGGTGTLVTDPGVPGKDLANGLRFVSSKHILHFEGTAPELPGYTKYSFPGKNARKININGTISPQNGELTIYNLPAGPYDLRIKIEPAVIFDWENAHVDLGKIIEGKKAGLSGSFPGGKGFDLSSMLDFAGDGMKNINFDRMDLYLYIDGDREKLEGSAIKLIADYGETRQETLTAGADGSGYVDFLITPGGTPDFAGSSVGEEDSLKVYSGELTGAQFELTDNQLAKVFNQWPENLRLEYEIRLASDFKLVPEDLDPDNNPETPATISLKPNVVVAFPLRLRLLAAEDDTGEPREGKLVLGNIFPEGDFLNREGKDDEIDEYIRQITYLDMDIEYDNTIGLDNTSVYLVSKNEDPERAWEKPMTLTEGEGQLKLNFTGDELLYPFMPEIEIRVPVRDGEDYGIIEIKRGTEEDPAGFTARISVKAAAEINQEIDIDF